MLKALTHFFLIGAALLCVSEFAGTSADPRPVIEVTVRDDEDASAVARAVEEAILLDQARLVGWDKTDPVVFNHLVANMRFVENDARLSEAELFAKAVELELHKHDPIVRSRLLYRAREALAVLPPDREPSEAQLADHLASHPERFRRSGRITFDHVFLGKDRRGASLPQDATDVGVALRAAELDAEAAHKLGDPLPGIHATQVMTLGRALSDFGVPFRAALRQEASSEWQGPITSVYGLHFVRVTDRAESVVPELEEIRSEVRADLVREMQSIVAKERMASLKDAYDVTVKKAAP